MATVRNYPSRHMRDRARDLRHGQTDAERALWTHLRNRGLEGAKFRRQQPIGPFIADFVCMEHGLVIELDGGQHASHVSTDGDRTAYLQHQGFRVLRFWNHEVLTQLDAVVARIVEALQGPHPDPLPEGEGVLQNLPEGEGVLRDLPEADGMTGGPPAGTGVSGNPHRQEDQ